MSEARPWDLLNPNMARSDQDLQLQRLAVCRTCEHFRAATSQCRLCGCIMPLKTRLADATCPDGRW